MAYLNVIDENIIYKAKLHWIIYVRAFLELFLGFFVFFTGNEILLLIGVILILIGFFRLIFAFIEKISTELAISERSVIAKRGFIRRDTIEVKLTKVESAHVKQSILGRILNYGSIVIVGSGNSYAPIKNIANPLEFRKNLSQILENISAK